MLPMARRGQQLGAAYFVFLIVAAIISLLLPAATFGDRLIHSLLVVCGAGVIVTIGLFGAMLVVGVREFFKSSRRHD